MTRLQSLDIQDLSANTRVGLKGKGAASWLEQHGITVPKQPNGWLSAHGQYVVLRLGRDEYVIECLNEQDLVSTAFVSTLADALTAKKRTAHDVYYVPRADACLQIDGDGAAQLLSQLCRLDVTTILENNALAITQVAGIAAVIIKVTAQQHCYRIWFDESYHGYILETIDTLSTHINHSETV